MYTLLPGDLASIEWPSASLFSEENGGIFLGSVLEGECFLIASRRSPFNRIQIVHSRHGTGWINCTYVRKVQNGDKR